VAGPGSRLGSEQLLGARDQRAGNVEQQAGAGEEASGGLGGGERAVVCAEVVVFACGWVSEVPSD